MGRALALATLLGGPGCRHLPPRGPSPSDRAEATARMVRLPDEDASTVHVVVAIDAGSAWDPDGKEGTAFRAAGARALGSPRGTRAAVQVGPEVVVVSGWCPAPGAWCREAVARWMLPPSEESLESAALRADAHRALADRDPSVVARRALDAWQWEGLAEAWPSAGRDDLVDTLRAGEVAAWDRTHAVRATTAVGLAGPVDVDAVSAAAAASLSLSARIPPEPARLDPVPLSGRLAVVVPADGVAWRIAGGALVEDGLAAAVVAAAVDPDGDPSPCAGTDAWPAPWERRRRDTWSVGGGAPNEASVVDALIAWEAGVGALRAPREGADAELARGKARLAEILESGLADPGCALASSTVAALWGVPEPMGQAVLQLDDVDVDRVARALKRLLPAEAVRIVVAAPDPEAMAAQLRAADGLRLDGVEVRAWLPWAPPGPR